MRIFYLLLLLFVGVWIVSFKPYEIYRQRTVDSMLTLQQFRYKELDTNHTRIELYGQKGRYVGKRFDVDEPVVIDWVKNERITAREGWYDKGIVTFLKDVNYTSKAYSAFAQKAIYDTNDRIFRIPTTFWLYAKGMNVTGKRLVYYKSSGKIVAYDIYAKVLQQ